MTGTGKSLVFTIPLIIKSMQLEKQMPIMSEEGPFGLVLVPSRELAI